MILINREASREGTKQALQELGAMNGNNSQIIEVYLEGDADGVFRLCRTGLRHELKRQYGASPPGIPGWT